MPHLITGSALIVARTLVIGSASCYDLRQAHQYLLSNDWWYGMSCSLITAMKAYRIMFLYVAWICHMQL